MLHWKLDKYVLQATTNITFTELLSHLHIMMMDTVYIVSYIPTELPHRYDSWDKLKKNGILVSDWSTQKGNDYYNK